MWAALLVLRTLAGKALGWLFGDWRRVVAVATILLLLWTHWEAYTSGKENVEQKYRAQQEAALVKAAAAAEKIKALQKQLADKQEAEAAKRLDGVKEKVDGVQASVAANPSPSGCDIPSDEQRLLNDLVREANKAGTH